MDGANIGCDGEATEDGKQAPRMTGCGFDTDGGVVGGEISSISLSKHSYWTMKSGIFHCVK